MRLGIFDLRFSIYAILFLTAVCSRAQTNVSPIDLPTVLRLANAQNLDIQIAREKLNEAKANHTSAVSQFFPWLAPGISYRRHDNLIQAVDGEFMKVHKQSYAPGATIGAQLDLGDAIYKNLAAKQNVSAAEHGLAAQRQESTFTAAQNYFELLFAQAAVGVAEESVTISTNYEAQIREAVSAGLAFKGDELRVKIQSERNRFALQQAREQRRVASTRLAQTLHLDPKMELVAESSELTPLNIFDEKHSIYSLIAEAIENRPDRKKIRASVASADAERKGAVYGPLIPTLSAQAFVGGLGGDSNAGRSRFDEQEDYFVGASWKIGSGGLLDFGRTRAAEARFKTVQLSAEKIDDAISSEVVNSSVSVQSLREQMATAKRVLAAAEEGLRLARLRKEFAVGVVLENIQAEQDLTRARFDYLKAIADFNSAQYALSRAVGKL